MAKVKHLSDGTNTWDVGGGTEVFTSTDMYIINFNVSSSTVSGDTVTILSDSRSMLAPNGSEYNDLMNPIAFGIPNGAIIKFNLTGNLPADTISHIRLIRTDPDNADYVINTTNPESMKSEYFTVMPSGAYYNTQCNEIAPVNKTVYDSLKVVSPLKVTNDGVNYCLGADPEISGISMAKSSRDYGYDHIRLSTAFSPGYFDTYFDDLTPVIYANWRDYDSNDECYTGIALNNGDEYSLVNDCILVVKGSSEGCNYAKIQFDRAIFGTDKTVHFMREQTSSGYPMWYFTTTRNMYFRVYLTNSDYDINLVPIENPSDKYHFIRNAYDIDSTTYAPVKDSTATINQIVGSILAVYGWGEITTNSSRAYVLQNSSGNNINPQNTITLIKDKEYIECQHFTAPVNGIYKLINSGGGSRPIIPIQAVSCSPNTSDADLCSNTSPVFYDNQTSATNRGWKLPQEQSWPSSGQLTDYCYNFFIFGELYSGV